MRADFFARRAHFVDHMAPVWKALEEERRGGFFVPEYLHAYAVSQGIDAIALPRTSPDLLSGTPNGPNPLVTCAYGDMVAAYKVRPQRSFILMEHGVGLTFRNPSYAGSLGLRRRVAMFLVPNEHTRAMNAKVLPMTPQVIIGCPKLDEFAAPPPAPPQMSEEHRAFGEGGRKPVVCISFHWNGSHIAPEAGNAFAHYQAILPELARQEDFTLIGHGHPKFPQLREVFEALGVEFIADFREVMQRADVYVNDCSSTMYEFIVAPATHVAGMGDARGMFARPTGEGGDRAQHVVPLRSRPVVLLNAPWFRRNIHHGIRFWEYSDIGPQVNEPGELIGTIQDILVAPGEYQEQREKTVRELYPYLGESAGRAAEAIEGFLEKGWPKRKRIEQVQGQSAGIIYMGFGAKAARGILQSITSMKRLGLDVPVAVVGDAKVMGTRSIPWEGQSPFDATQRPNFQFRAGRVKPFLFALSPFERTLYIDADTEFMSDFSEGFNMLSEYDMLFTEDALALGQLYNQARAGWEYKMTERDATIEELGGDRTLKLFNSGVIFFRKTEATEELFCEWQRQWMIWQNWDEQLALRRAIGKCNVKYKALGLDWNHPHKEKAKIIFHNYGRGNVRVNAR